MLLTSVQDSDVSLIFVQLSAISALSSHFSTADTVTVALPIMKALAFVT
jgi:hypothetical protein